MDGTTVKIICKGKKDSISKNIDALYTKVDNKNIQQLLKLFNQGRSII